MAVRPEDGGPRREEALDDLRRGVAEPIPAPHADEGEARGDPREEPGGRRRAAPVVRDLEDVGREVGPPREEVRLGRRFDVARQEDPPAPEADGEDERAVVLGGARVPVGSGVEDVERDSRRGEAVSGAERLDGPPARRGREGLVEELVPRRAAREDEPADREELQRREQAPRVVRMRVRQDDRVEGDGPERSETRRICEGEM